MNLIHKYRHAVVVLAACCLFLPTVLFAETATFDNLEEGLIGDELTGEFTDGDITFFGLDNGNPDVDNVFIIEHADGTLSAPPFSAPNGLTATAYTAGAEAAFGAIKEMSMKINGDADAVSIDVYTAGTLLYVNTVTLEALDDGVVVDSVSIAMSEVVSNQFTLSLDGTVFDTLRLVSSPNSQVLLLDNVTITPTNTCACDIDKDGDCDTPDYSLFRRDWGSNDCQNTADGCACDIDQDGDCDTPDFSLFRQDWNRDECR